MSSSDALDPRTAADRRLVEYFVIVSSVENSKSAANPSQAQNNGDISFNDWKTDSGYDDEEEMFTAYPFKPIITARYPLYDHTDNPLHDNVVFFCHPSGKIELRTEQVMPKVGFWLLLVESIDPLYKFCGLTCMVIVRFISLLPQEERDGKSMALA
jgi:hypothetical protein